MEKPLNPRQLRFVEHYLKSGNATEAYRLAGYKGTGRTAENNASRLLGHAGVSAAIEAANSKAAENCILTAEWVLNRLQREATLDGKGSSHSARVKALELLGRRFGLFPNQHEHSGSVEMPITVNLASLSTVRHK